MMSEYTRFYIGIDNGISGAVGVIAYSPTLGYRVDHIKTPVVVQQNYTKKVGSVTRIDGPRLFWFFKKLIPDDIKPHVLIERPFVNPKMFQASLSAIRAMEATQIILDTLGYGYEFIDSKQWQKELLPTGTKGTDQLKSASLHVASRLYPEKLIKGHKDADGLLIAHYCMLKNK